MRCKLKKILVLAIAVLALFTSCDPFKKQNEVLSASTFYHFDTASDMGGWNNNGLAYETLSINTDTNYIKVGPGSLKCAVTLKPGQPAILYQYFSSFTNLTNRNVSIWIYVPSDLAAIGGYYLTLYYSRDSLSTTTPLEFKAGPQLNTTGWVQAQYTFPATTMDEYNVEHDFHDVKEMYFSVENIQGRSPANWPGNIYFDELSW
jgi:hypothetical protein